ncbi:ATP-binding protein [Pasteurellaceae bacterium LIM206]|nr:ATP-binding protein [Pasteurellaceae bacterium LIM206]
MKSRQSIRQILRNALVLSLFFTTVIGMVSLYSWYQQGRRIHYIIEDYFPASYLALKLEDQVNMFTRELDRFSMLKNHSVRQSMFNQLNDQINVIHQLGEQLSLRNKGNFQPNLTALSGLIDRINRNQIKHFQIEQKKQELLTKIQWVNDDFNNEVVTLIQEISSQQTMIALQSDPHKVGLLARLQQELQTVYQLAALEEQIKNELIQFIYALNNDNLISRYEEMQQLFSVLQQQNQEKITQPSIILLKEMVGNLFNKTDLDGLISDIQYYQQQAHRLEQQKIRIIQQIKQLTGQFLAENQQSFSDLNKTLKNNTALSGMIIAISLFIALIFIWAFYQFYIKANLSLRLAKIIHAITRLNQGDNQPSLDIVGNDEITQIAHLLKTHIHLLQERSIIVQNLKETQDELIQTAKLAVVGQTMSTLAHEINQPLNAMSIYLFTLRKKAGEMALKDHSVMDAVDHIERLTERIHRIIKGLRQFSKKNSSDNALAPVNLTTIIQEAWQLLVMRHKSMSAVLTVDGDANVLAQAVLLEQVFVNLFNNALDAHKDSPLIEVNIQFQNEQIRVSISDNGEGWGNADAEKLMRPFYTNKAVGLGLGLVICQKIMRQFSGDLYLASNLHKGAVIILVFPLLQPALTV